MRGVFSDQGRLFSYISPEARVPANHPLRKIRNLVRDVLGELNRSLTRLYASEGRPSIPPEQLLSSAVTGSILSTRQAFAGPLDAGTAAGNRGCPKQARSRFGPSSSMFTKCHCRVCS